MELTLENRIKLRKDILTYLGCGVSDVELTKKQLDLAINLGMESSQEKKENLFDMCLGHSMIMLGMIRLKFSEIPTSDGLTINMTENAKELIKTGKELIYGRV